MLALTAMPAFSQEATVTAEVRLPQREIFVHESFEMEVVIRATGVRLGQSFRLVGLPGDDAMKRGDFGELPARQESVGNVTVEVRRFRCEGTALQSGTMHIAPTLEFSVLRRAPGFFGLQWEESAQRIAMQPADVVVRALPLQGKPEAFSGAVGSFAMTTEIAPSDVAVGDLIKVTSTVRGRGWLDGVRPPSLSAAPGFRLYEAQSLPLTSAGEARFEQTAIPQSETATELPPVTFVYFDPATRSYETLRQGPFAVRFHNRTAVNFTPYRPTAVPQPAQSAPGTPQAPAAENARIRVVGIVIGYWVVAGAVTVLVFRRGRKLRWIAIAVPVLALAGFGPVLQWASHGRQATNERILARAERARFAPSPGADGVLELAAGASVRVTESWGSWRRVSVQGEGEGWLPADALSEPKTTAGGKR